LAHPCPPRQAVQRARCRPGCCSRWLSGGTLLLPCGPAMWPCHGPRVMTDSCVAEPTPARAHGIYTRNAWVCQQLCLSCTFSLLTPPCACIVPAQGQLHSSRRGLAGVGRHERCSAAQHAARQAQIVRAEHHQRQQPPHRRLWSRSQPGPSAGPGAGGSCSTLVTVYCVNGMADVIF
jgi:hypothetical protein